MGVAGAAAVVAVIGTGGLAAPAVIAATAAITGGASIVMGGSDFAEGIQDIKYGLSGDSTTASYNPVRDTVFGGNQTVYDMVKIGVSFGAGISTGILNSADDIAKSVGNVAKNASYKNPYGAASVADDMVDDVITGGTTSGADNIATGAKLKEFYRQAEKYGTDSIKELENGKFRFYGDVKAAAKEGEMAGARLVREWDPTTGSTRTWYETVDHAGNIRQVRPNPDLTGGVKTHYMFDVDGNYTGSWTPEK